MDFLHKYEKDLSRLVLLLLCLLVLSRFFMSWKNAGFIDTRYYVETARLILQGISPYHPEANPTPFKYPIQSPSMSLLSMPFCFTPQIIQNLFSFLGGILTFLLYTVMVFNFYGYHMQQYLRARWQNLPIWLVLAAILISSPHLMMLSHGQNSSFAALLLFAALLYPKRDHSLNILLLGGAAALKYSLLTMQIPVLLLQRKRWLMGLEAFLLFILLVLSVGFWLDGIVPAFKDYLGLLTQDVLSGMNSYANQGSYNFIHTSFFRQDVINFTAKALLILLYVFSLYNIWRRNQQKMKCQTDVKDNTLYVSATEWGAFTAMTMCISYHRAYDAIIFLPFLGVSFLESLNVVCGKEKYNIAAWLSMFCLGGLILFWSVPASIAFSLENRLGTFFQNGQIVFHYSHYRIMGHTMMFPLTKIVMFFTTFFLFVKCLAESQGLKNDK